MELIVRFDVDAGPEVLHSLQGTPMGSHAWSLLLQDPDETGKGGQAAAEKPKLPTLATAEQLVPQALPVKGISSPLLCSTPSLQIPTWWYPCGSLCD